MAHVELDLRERRIIQKLSDQGVRVAEIAQQVGCRRISSIGYRRPEQARIDMIAAMTASEYRPQSGDCG